MAYSEPKTSQDFTKLANAYRRKLADLVSHVSLIKDWGKKASDDPTDKQNVAFFRGMLKSLETHYSKYEELWQMFDDLQDEGATGIPSKEDADARKSVRGHYYSANKYAQLLEMYYEEVNRTRELTMVGGNLGTNLNESKIARSLPKINLPTFDGTHANWPNYRDTYVSLVHSDEAMTGVSKLHYLRSSLTSPALSLITHLAITDANYSLAWKTIKETYENKRLLAYTYLGQILEAKPISGRATCDSLKSFLASVGDSVSALQLLNIPNQSDYILFYLAVRALDPVTRELFETANKEVEFPSVDDLIKFVRERMTSLMLANSGSPGTSQQTPKTPEQKPPQPKDPSKTTLLSQDQKTPSSKKAKAPKQRQEAGKPSETPERAHSNGSKSPPKHPPCFICKDANHHLLSCEKFHQASADDRWKLIAKWNGCTNCLNANHSAENCPSTWSCRFCPERHHSSLQGSTRSPTSSPASDQAHSLNATTQEDAQVILGTALVEILDARGQFQTVRVVLDSGSQNSFITQKCLNRLGLTMQHLRKRISGIGQTPFEGTKGKTSCILQPLNKPALQLRTEAIVVSNITSYLPMRTLPQSIALYCSKFPLADPEFWKPSPINFLVGADLFAQIITGSAIPIEGSQARLFSSIFGYVVLGKVEGSATESYTSLFTMAADEDLNVQLKKFWEIEEPSASARFRNPDDERCEDHFKRTHSRQPDGRYVVRLPFEEDPPTVGDSSFVARKRFLNLEKKLEANPGLKKSYHEVIADYLALDHMTPAFAPTRFIIPHHCVSKAEGESVKVRVVFDASVNVPNGSLNDHLLVGEKLQRDIRDVVLSFRQHRVVFSADIVKMFRMIVVDKRDRGFIQIFWRFDKREEVRLLELKTLPFGLSSSPFIAIRVLKQLCLDHGSDYPSASHVLQRDIYVDDVLTGASTDEDALELKNQLISLLDKGGFQLSKWVSNSKHLLDSAEEGSVKSILSLSDKEDSWVKLLGLQWDQSEDAFLFSLQTPTPVYSKRGILSAVARLYDPLGFLTPVTLLMKSIVQDLWKLGIQWDDDIPANIRTLWDTVLGELHFLASIRIPRFLHTTGQYKCHVVGFADASSKAYAAVIYLRVYVQEMGWQVSFLTSKSKLAPTKATLIPRLELSGVVLLKQLYAANQDFFDSLPAPFAPPTFHTDSSIVLAWLNTPTFKLQTFVANRVAKVQEMTPTNSWRHVDSEENPNDVASRGLLPSQLPSDELWWKGPSWLTLNQLDWPAPTYSVAPDIPELKPAHASLVSSYTENPWIPWMSNYSAFLRILRIIAWVKRWIYNVRHVGCCCCPMRTGHLKLFELDLALNACIGWVQDHHLFHGHPFSVVAQKFARLQPFMDQTGIVRVGGRIRRADLSDARRFPILMPVDAHLTVLMEITTIKLIYILDRIFSRPSSRKFTGFHHSVDSFA